MDRVDVDRFAGVEDPVRIIQIWHTPLQRDPGKHYVQYPRPIWEVYQELDPGQIEQIGAHAIEWMDRDEHRGLAIAGALASFTGADLRNVQLAMLARGHCDPPHLFRGAGSEVRDRLLEAKLAGGPREISPTLLALAWIGDEVVQARFAAWRATPPPWAAKLYIPPADYTRYAGWELTAEGTRRELTLEPCWPLVSGDSAVDPAVSTMGVSAEGCGWCGRALTRLLDIDTSDPRFRAWDLGGGHAGVATCLACTCHGFVFSESDEAGGMRWASHNERPSSLPDDEPEDAADDGWRPPVASLALGAAPRLPTMAVDWGLAPPGSQIGGLPSWIQDADYPRCFGCEETMVFLGQIAVEDVMEYGEGIFYAFLCPPCRTGATTFQQT